VIEGAGFGARARTKKLGSLVHIFVLGFRGGFDAAAAVEEAIRDVRANHRGQSSVEWIAMRWEWGLSGSVGMGKAFRSQVIAITRLVCLASEDAIPRLYSCFTVKPGISAKCRTFAVKTS
jgi:hypothetical protein